MNTNPKAKRILCFGDSNTFGFIPLTNGLDRYPSNIRWTGLLQNLLGKDYEIIEEGLNARLTIYEDPRIGFIGKSAKTYLIPCLETHRPIDLIILMLGTPEAKEIMNLTSKDIVKGIEELIKIINSSKSGNNQEAPKILLISPILLDETTEFAKMMFGKGATKKIKQLPSLYKTIAKKYNCAYICSSDFVKADTNEGVHLTTSGHKILAGEIYKKVLEIF